MELEIKIMHSMAALSDVDVDTGGRVSELDLLIIIVVLFMFMY